MMVSDDGHRLAFDKRELAVLTGMMAKEDRTAYAALWFHGGRAQAWATDGHRAVLVERDPKPPRGNPDASPVAIPAAAAHHVAKTAGARDLIVIDTSGAEVRIELRERTSRTVEINAFADIEGRTRSKHVVTCKRHEMGYARIDFAFPSCRGRGGKGLTVPFSPALLAPVLALGSLTGDFVWLNIGDDGPILFLATAEDGAVWRLVVMPKRDGGLTPPDREPPPMPGEEPAKAASRAKPASRAKAASRAKPPAPASEPASPASEPASPAAAVPAKPRRGRKPRGSAAA